jgi:aromatic-L-amino-acid decarboxylase
LAGSRTDGDEATNLMDLGFQLGRRFRALKLWLVICSFGVDGLRERLREHCAMARDLAAAVAADPAFELAAPVPLSVVCFRARAAAGGDPSPAAQDRLNEKLLAAVNAAGPFFLSHTVLDGRYTLRVAIGNLRTTRRHLDDLWQLVRRSAASLAAAL